MYNHQLDTFLQVAKLGSFSKAAEALYISPTAVIKQMNLLERTAGVRLFDRTHRGLTLTKAGESLEKDARRIIRLCEQAADRARQAEISECSVVRVATSIMTPATLITSQWQKVHERYPELSVKLVSFENNPENAQRMLAHMGDEIDVVCGVFDEGFLSARGCAGTEFASEPLRLAVSMTHPLAAKGTLTWNDLDGETLLLIKRGWLGETDRLRDEIEQHHPSIAIEDFDLYSVDAFNRAEQEGKLLVTIDPWASAHPMVRTLPVEWDFSLAFGILHAKDPSQQVQELLGALKDEPEQPR